MRESKGKKSVRNVVVALLSVAMIVGFVLLFIAASKDRNDTSCKGIHLEVKGTPAHLYIDQKEITAMIRSNKTLNPVGKPLSSLSIAALERSVKTFPWVKDAELYLDNDNILQILITERVPVTRVFTTSGASFFLDQEGTRLPVTGSFATRMPVFTGFPDEQSASAAADSGLIVEMTAISAYLSGHPFWMAQVGQVNINALREFELVPTVGSALIELGDGTHLDAKFSKLLVFYRQALNNVGWGYYDTLDLRFQGQVVASRKRQNQNPVVDSLMSEGSYQHSPESTPALVMRSGAQAEVTHSEMKIIQEGIRKSNKK